MAEGEIRGSHIGLGSADTALVEKKVKNYKKNDEFTRPSRANKTNTGKQPPRITAENPKDFEVYNFKDSGIGESWLIGTDNAGNPSDYANAYIDGYSQCPENITVPRNLTNKARVTKPVEVIGQWAYSYCGLNGYGSKTKSVFITKQVKVIKTRGFGSMYNIENFRIEEGSVLETIGLYGLYYIGNNIGKDDEKKRGTLTLPSTLSSVVQNGIYRCNLFNVIIYCGTHPLTAKCELQLGDELETNVKVTYQYSEDTIFGQTPLKNSPMEVNGNCSKMEQRITPNPTPSSSPSSSSSPSRSASPSLFPTPTPSCNCPRSPLKRSTPGLTSLFATLLPSQSYSSSSSSTITPSSFSLTSSSSYLPSCCL